jgi:MerR family copper efflux transcriptional regulator
MAFAQRLRGDGELRAAVDGWFEAQPERPEDVPASDWLRFEQEKHERLLAAAAQLT